MKHVVITLVTAISMLGCATRPKDSSLGSKSITVHLGEHAVMDETSLKKMSELAHGGDGPAAYAVAMHYAIGIGDPEKASYYRKLAITAEYPPAVYAEAIRAWDIDGDAVRARSLLKRALELGHPDTANLDKEIP